MTWYLIKQDGEYSYAETDDKQELLKQLAEWGGELIRPASRSEIQYMENEDVCE